MRRKQDFPWGSRRVEAPSDVEPGMSYTLPLRRISRKIRSWHQNVNKEGTGEPLDNVAQIGPVDFQQRAGFQGPGADQSATTRE